MVLPITRGRFFPFGLTCVVSFYDFAVFFYFDLENELNLYYLSYGLLDCHPFMLTI